MRAMRTKKKIKNTPHNDTDKNGQSCRILNEREGESLAYAVLNLSYNQYLNNEGYTQSNQ